jgi:hypothetical protein
MAEVFVLALSFPSVVFTVLLGVVLVYWTFVMVGVIHIGEGSEGALEGKLEGATKGLLEGAVHGLEAHGDLGDFGDAADLGDAGDAGDALGHTEAPGGLAALVSALHLRSVPATVIISLVVTFSWLVSVVVMQLVTRAAPALAGYGLSAVVVLVAPVLALPLTSIAARPLAKVFVVRRAPAKSDLIGQTCVVRTGTVNDKFGEATLADGGAGLVLQVRVDVNKQLSRGEQALIIDYDSERETFLVEPMSDLLAERR